jgi:hypothetical protein
VFFIFNSLFLYPDFLILPNSKQWLDYEQFCTEIFRSDGLEGYYIISQIDVYERLIHAAIQQKKSPPYLYYETHIP